LARDTAPSARQAFQIVDRGRASAPRYRPRTAFAAYVGLLGQARFGAGSSEGAAATALLATLKEADEAEVEYLALARLASQVASGSVDSALSPAMVARSADHAALAGEAALTAGKSDLAIVAFSTLLKAEKSARAHFGLARAQLMAGNDEAAEREAKAVLEGSPGHVGAQLLLAERQVRRRKADAQVVEVLVPFSKGEGGASVGERTEALILLGEIHMARGRLNDAEKAFSAALGLESGNAVAQRGLADALFESGRFSEAQTRYEAALKTDASSLSAGLGLVRCRIRLEELETAVNLLGQLKKQHTDSTALQYWSWRVEEQLGHREEAEKAYRAAIEKAESGAPLVKSYIALTRLLGQKGETLEADEVIREAEEKFPDDPLVYEAQADLASARGSFEAAVEDYERALALDPDNLGLHFAKAVALRKGRQFERAEKELALVERAEKNYPGLALEQGNLLEASGRSAEALSAYEKALAEAPDSGDMKLRVGCARASAGQGEPAVKVLEEVYDDRPNSAEVNFCLGLGLLHMNKLEEARRHLQRAVGFDASRANYHMYVGWVAIEMGNYPLASTSLEKALSLDRTLADAYWKRGELRVKQGAVDDAVRDLRKALELSPSRYEAHAQLGLAYLQNGREPQALEEFGKATEQPGVDPYFNYRYGELLLNNRRPLEARPQLERAVAGVEGDEFPPPWTWEAHRLLAMTFGRTKEALPHWKAFAEHAASNSPYLADATREMDAILRSIGH
jgi:tetratricopeptide (TPR) repeat protein